MSGLYGDINDYTTQLRALKKFFDSKPTDLVGPWVAQARDTKIELSVAEDSQFVWKAGGTNQAAVELSGQLSSSGDGIELTTAEQGTIAGIVTSKGLNGWNFAITGSESLSSLPRAIEGL